MQGLNVFTSPLDDIRGLKQRMGQGIAFRKIEATAMGYGNFHFTAIGNNNKMRHGLYCSGSDITAGGFLPNVAKLPRFSSPKEKPRSLYAGVSFLKCPTLLRVVASLLKYSTTQSGSSLRFPGCSIEGSPSVHLPYGAQERLDSASYFAGLSEAVFPRGR